MAPFKPTSLFTTVKTPLGEIVLTSSGKGITGVYTPKHSLYKKMKGGISVPKPFKEALKQLKEYFEGKRRTFRLPLGAQGTPFQKNVWKALCDIPFGETKSYGELAKAVRSPKASRAVGAANGKNPLCIFGPCHRVIGANGKLTGFAGGIKAKAWLLNHEAGLLKKEFQRFKSSR